ncbi:MAG TPA: hypothetical protein VJV21_07990 [Pyrinomonadaceae bacterium]|nr:hypothetical protein [Pyrinomonadaceae bacterium]
MANCNHRDAVTLAMNSRLGRRAEAAPHQLHTKLGRMDSKPKAIW